MSYYLKLIIALTFILFCLLFFQFTIDDSYISWRYAKNLIHFQKWDFNLSFERVEAYTSFIYAALATIPLFLSVKIEIFFKLFSLMLLAIKFWQYRDRINSLKYQKLLVLAFTILHPYFYLHLFSGLETPLFMFLFFDYLMILTKEQLTRANFRYLYLIFLLLPLTRPEGALFSIAGFSYLLFTRKHLQEKSFLAAILFVGCFYYIWRYFYFGYPFPNTYYAKSYPHKTLSNIYSLFEDKAAWILYAFVLTFLNKNKGSLFFTILTVACFGLAYGNSHLWTNFGDRFLFQIFVPLFCYHLFNAYNLQTYKAVFLVILSLVIINVRLIAKNEVISYGIFSWPRSIEAHGCLADAITRNFNYRPRIIMGDVGLIPYKTDADILDIMGLANPVVAQGKITNSYINDFNADIAIIYSNDKNPNAIGFSKIPGDLRIYASTLHSSGYSYAGSLEYFPNKYLNIYTSKKLQRNHSIYKDLDLCIANSREFTNSIGLDNQKFITKFLHFGYL